MKVVRASRSECRNCRGFLAVLQILIGIELTQHNSPYHYNVNAIRIGSVGSSKVHPIPMETVSQTKRISSITITQYRGVVSSVRRRSYRMSVAANLWKVLEVILSAVLSSLLDCALKQLGECYSILRALTYSWEYNTIAMLKIGFISDFYSIYLQNVMDHDIFISYPKYLFSRMKFPKRWI